MATCFNAPFDGYLLQCSLRCGEEQVGVMGLGGWGIH